MMFLQNWTGSGYIVKTRADFRGNMRVFTSFLKRGVSCRCRDVIAFFTTNMKMASYIII